MGGVRRGRSGLGTALLVTAAAAVVAVALFRVPLATVFTVGVVLICPLMMFGMHGSHGTHGPTEAGGRGQADEGSHQHPARG